MNNIRRYIIKKKTTTTKRDHILQKKREIFRTAKAKLS